MVYECLWCGENFSQYPAKHSKFCSRQCRDASRCTKVELECIICKSSFIVGKSRINTAKFCSRKCKGVYTSQTYTGTNAFAWKGGMTHDAKGYLQISHGKHYKQRLHKVRAEQALGKPLPIKAVVHHVNGDIENPNAQLVICEDQSYHLLLHKLARQKQKERG
jgi:hypothetical protein